MKNTAHNRWEMAHIVAVTRINADMRLKSYLCAKIGEICAVISIYAPKTAYMRRNGQICASIRGRCSGINEKTSLKRYRDVSSLFFYYSFKKARCARTVRTRFHSAASTMAEALTSTHVSPV